jgi:hypothetical protein
MFEAIVKNQMIKFLLIIFLFPALAHGQLKGFSIGGYIEAAQPSGNLGETNKNGFGTGIGADIRLGKLGLTGSAGFIHFAGKKIDKGDESFKMPAINAFPLRLGIKYRIKPFLYARLESGIAEFIGNREPAIIVAPGIAVRFLGIEVLAKYEIWKNEVTYSFWGLKTSFNF